MPAFGAFKYQLSNRVGPFDIEDYRRLARRRVPAMVWSYVDYGAEDLTTLAANRSAFDRYVFRRRILTGQKPNDIGVVVGGQQLDLPILLSPLGSVGLSHWTGERGVAQAAERAGTRSIVSTASTYSFEEVAEATRRDHFFQLYPWTDIEAGTHDTTLGLVGRAQRAGYQALFLTVDVASPGNRLVEKRLGMGHPPVMTPGAIWNAALRPSWCVNFLRHRRMSLRNLVEERGAKAAMDSVGRQLGMMRPELNWQDFQVIRDNWRGPMFVKGVIDADDAERAVDLGADGIVVSNHGGRQLDGDVAALDALPAVVARVGDRAEVLLEGGVRRGADVVKALCLGAKAVCIGRPYMYGLGAAGPKGVEDVIRILREETVRVMTLMGVGSLAELNPSLLLPANTVLDPGSKDSYHSADSLEEVAP
jgi:isopentenyl diphosphate isomerase/L-lactate dehydrogenase-like FMN-dependent dehydrogenase